MKIRIDQLDYPRQVRTIDVDSVIEEEENLKIMLIDNNRKSNNGQFSDADWIWRLNRFNLITKGKIYMNIRASKRDKDFVQCRRPINGYH